MRLNFQFPRYDSKLATIVSMLQSGIAGWIFFYAIFSIPAFICLACGLSGVIVGTLFGVMFVVSVIAFILFCKFVKPEKIDERAQRKKKPQPPHDSQPHSYQSEEERRQALIMRSYIGSQISAEKTEKKDDLN